MIKHLTLFLIVSLVTIASGVWLAKDPGYLLIIFHHWQIETSLVVFFLVVLSSLIFLRFGTSILKFIVLIPFKLLNAFKFWRNQSQKKAIQQGLQAYFEEHWTVALKKLSTQNNSPWTIDLLGAEAAQHHGDIKQRDFLIAQALKAQPSAKESIILFHTKLQIEQQQFEEAQANLNKIDITFQKNSSFFHMLQTQLDIHFKNFTRGLLRLNTHIKLLQSHPKFISFYHDCFTHELQTLINQNKLSQAIICFKNTPKSIQEDATIIKIFVPAMNKTPDEFKFLIKIIRKQLKSNPTNELTSLLPQLPNTALWIKELEQLNKDNNRNANLLLTLGQLKAKQKLWGSAIQLLNESIDLNPSEVSYKELAKIYLEINQNEQALECFQKICI